MTKGQNRLACGVSLCEGEHLCSVTEAGEGEDGRMKSAIGIGSLLMDGLGDTIRVSLTEDPEYEMAPCRCEVSFCYFCSLRTQ